MTSKTKSLESNRKALNVSGLRITSQRSLILEIIRRGHLDADEIFRQARTKQPRLSLSTVYRTLQALKKLGLVEELHFDDTHHHYEMKPPSEHQHLVCLGCGKVVEFKCPLSIKRMKENIAREKGFEVTGVEIRMTGYCPKCRQNRK
ncbi:Ferric uptake regulation protein [subsurface metagenome]|jgi:Fe2+ or Zn2+ uptake regulation protein